MGGEQVLIQPPACDLEKFGHSPDPLFAVGQSDRDKGMLQSATKGSAVFCEWNAKQFPSHSQDRCALCVCGWGESWVGSMCDLGTEAGRARMSLSGVVAHYRGWVLSIIVQHSEENSMGIPGHLGAFSSSPEAASLSKFHALRGR